jgi:hypothetical protein
MCRVNNYKIYVVDYVPKVTRSLAFHQRTVGRIFIYP